MNTTFDEIEARRIKPDSQVPKHDFLYRWGDKPCFARGELVALTGKAKSGKTYVCSMLMALGIRQQLMGFTRIQDEPLTVVWIDTEQSEDSTQEILCHRIQPLINQDIPEDKFYVYNLRKDDWQDRFSWVKLFISRSQPDLVIFDGIRDVVGDINNYQEAQTVLGALLSLASWSQACFVCVVHKNKALEDKTLRGALGTELQNKSYETYECQKDPDTRLFTLRQTATRKYDITQKLTFSVNQAGLPEVAGANLNAIEGGYNSGYSLYAQQIDAQAIIPKIFGALTTMRAYDFKQKAMRCFPEINCDSAYRVLLSQAYQLGLISKRKLSETEIYYDLCSPQKTEDRKEEIPSLF